MPCQGGMPYREIVKESGEIIDSLTQKLCYLCASLYADDLLEKYASPEIIAWHKAHMHKDEMRVGKKMQALFRAHPERMNDTDTVAEEFLQVALKVHPVSNYHRQWFKNMARDAAKAIRAATAEEKSVRDRRQNALAKLSPEEREALGL